MNVIGHIETGPHFSEPIKLVTNKQISKQFAVKNVRACLVCVARIRSDLWDIKDVNESMLQEELNPNLTPFAISSADDQKL